MAQPPTPPAEARPCPACECDDDDDEDPFEWEVRDGSTPFWQHAVAGSCAGVMEHVSMYPLDTVKTHVQASPVRLSIGEAVRAVLRNQGVLGLMRGSFVIGAGCVPAHAGFFGTYELATAKFAAEGGPHQPMRMAACGAAATTIHDAILTPHDVAKQRLQLGRHGGAVDCALSIWRQEGLRGFYRSLPVTLAMNVPYNGMLVACNDSLQRFLQVGRGGGREAKLADAPWHFFCAGISGAVAGAATTPLDVIKTRMQTQTRGSASGAAGGILGVARAVVREGGVRGLFQGMGPRVLLAVPSAAVSWGTYETVRAALKDLSSASLLSGGPLLVGGVDLSRSVVSSSPQALVAAPAPMT